MSRLELTACLLAALPTAAMAQVTWMQVSTTGPAARYDFAMAYDGQRQRTVVFGGTGSGTWLWNGAMWTQGPATGPGRRGHAMAYDSLRGRVVLFGGHNGMGPLGDTWVPNHELLRAPRRFSMRLA